MTQLYERALSIGPSDTLAVASDETSLAVVSGHHLNVWDLDRAERTARVRWPHGSGVDWSRDGKQIAAMNTSGRCAVFAAADIAAEPTIGAQTFGEGPGPLFAPGHSFVHGSWEGDLVVRSAADGGVLMRAREAGRRITRLAATGDRSMFVYVTRGDDGTTIRLRKWPFDQNDAEDVLALPRASSAICDAAINDHGQLAVRTREELFVVDLETGRPAARRRMSPSGTDEAIAWCPAGELVATDSSTDGKLVRGMTDALEDQWHLSLPYACAAAYSSSGRFLALGSWEKGVVLRRIDDGA
jgi:hypothetical protein